MIIDSVKLPHTNLVFFENNVLEIQLGDNFFYTIIEAKEINDAIEKISKGKKVKALLLAGTYSDCDTATRMYISSEEICSKLSSMALVTRSLAHDILANFIIHFDQPSVPAKAFNSKDKAMEWLLRSD